MLIKKIIHLLTLLTLLTVLPAFQCLAEFTDTDWNMEFNDHCGFPKTEGDYKSVKWAKDGPNKFLRFELRKNDAGLCEKDDRKRRSSSFRERAQVLQNNTLERDKKYSLEFEVRFVKGFHGIGERFLTLDQTTEGDPYTGVCNGPIPLSLAASSGLIYIQIIKSGPPISSPGLKHERVLKSGGKQNFGEWIKFKLVLDTSKNSKVSIYRNGKLMLDGHPFLIKNCAELNFSAGIYRYGGYNDTSIVNFDKFKLKTIEEDRLKTSVIAGREVKNNTLRYKNEAGDFVSFNILDTENFSTRYKISGFPGYDNTEVVKVVGGISISGGRPYSPHHRHLQTTIDPGNQAKLKTFLTKPLGSSVTYQVQENWSNYALTRQWGMLWSLTSTILSKEKRNVNGVTWDTILIGTEGESIKGLGRESSWAETEITFSENRLVEANTGITLNFERQWGETANSPAKACDPCGHPPDHLEKLILHSIGNVKIADLARKQQDHKDQ